MLGPRSFTQPHTKRCSPILATSRHAFTLVELAIVLVIIGLITGGVLVGQDLMRAGEIRNAMNQFQQFKAAAHAFRTAYGGIPGDITRATSYWGGAPAVNVPGSGTQTWNGDGDGMLDYGSFASYNEWSLFWQHLGNAKMVGGSFTGMSGPNANEEVQVGINAPGSKLGRAGWQPFSIGSVPDGDYFAGNYGNAMFLGDDISDHMLETSALRAEAAASIDEKMDDGKPGKGMVRAARNFNTACRTTADAETSEYNVLNENYDCILIFLKVI
tara:strand:+ start:1001 stop:1813 length:813 start_codon:yes stop_codon:yes gene_type:complete